MLIRIFAVALCFGLIFAFLTFENPSKSANVYIEEPGAAELVIETLQEEHTVKPNSTTYESLIEAGLTPQEINSIVKAAKPHLDLSRVTAGTQYSVTKTKNGHIRQLTFYIRKTQKLFIDKGEEFWTAQLKKIPTTTRVITYSGIVEDSLWNSGMKAEISPYLVTSLAEVFSWQVDFHREIRKGDTWKFTTEELLIDGEHVGWGKLLKAQYKNGDQTYRAYYYEKKSEKIWGHFTDQGKSLRRLFLKSPLKFGRITSHFSRRRFHPVRKTFRAHRGVDYGAPTGTPIRAIGNGTVIKRKRSGASGNMITLRHPGNYTSKYLHLSRFKSNVKKGSRVEQGEIIGYVGKTGLATGPHLHFELLKAGVHKDPVRIKLPPSKSIPAQFKAEYLAYVAEIDKKYPYQE